MTSQKNERRGTPLDLNNDSYLRQLIAEASLIERVAESLADRIRDEFVQMEDFDDFPHEDRQMLLQPLQVADQLRDELDLLRSRLCERFVAITGGEPEPPARKAPSKPANATTPNHGDVPSMTAGDVIDVVDELERLRSLMDAAHSLHRWRDVLRARNDEGGDFRADEFESCMVERFDATLDQLASKQGYASHGAVTHDDLESAGDAVAELVAQRLDFITAAMYAFADEARGKAA